MIVDFHTHIFPDALAEKAVASLAAAAGLEPHTAGTADALLASMAKAGVTHSVVCNIAVKPHQTEKTNAFAASLMQQYADRGLIAFAGLHPQDPDWRQTLADIKAAGFAGVKLHPDYHQVFIDDPIMPPILDEIARLGLVLIIHAGVDLGMPPPYHATPERIWNVLEHLERGTTVIAHMGGFDMYADVLELLCGRRLYLDTSFALYNMDVQTAREIVDAHGIDRVVFGTDSPWVDQAAAVAFVKNEFARGFLTKDKRDLLLYGNAAGVLGL